MRSLGREQRRCCWWRWIEEGMDLVGWLGDQAGEIPRGVRWSGGVDEDGWDIFLGFRFRMLYI